LQFTLLGLRINTISVTRSLLPGVLIRRRQNDLHTTKLKILIREIPANKCYQKENKNLYSSPSVIKIKKNKMGRTFSMHVGMGNLYKILLGKTERRNHMGYLGIGGRIILKWFLKNQDWMN
jgi:hypothetical protein